MTQLVQTPCQEPVSQTALKVRSWVRPYGSITNECCAPGARKSTWRCLGLVKDLELGPIFMRPLPAKKGTLL